MVTNLPDVARTSANQKSLFNRLLSCDSQRAMFSFSTTLQFRILTSLHVPALHCRRGNPPPSLLKIKPV
ncbi:hypothetical protein T4B_15067 [Trichinella pseudospiralis]|uniref:Uncharacterized protein n=1 Tax=Trichinella pseudospiralis TaxID=6337 RepID=A0A0V1JA44_TRIPS|nr:hypothetical protein T4B_15067 [Trichinella pseudospiralis]